MNQKFRCLVWLWQRSGIFYKMNHAFALVDCNSFFCSCERLFRPDLVDKPVGVLSSNDGCFVSRTPELKKIGVAVGVPYFQVRELCQKNKVHIFSSNFSLYTNMSDRVMDTLRQFTPSMQVYSVDEAFLEFSGFSELQSYALQIKATVDRHTGIPVSVGIGPTKTLAKVANHLAKSHSQYSGVMVLDSVEKQDDALKQTAVEDVWGIGRRTAAKLHTLSIQTAWDFKHYKNKKHILKFLGKIGAQIQDELQGEVRFPLNTDISPKKSIIASRSFGKAIDDIEGLRQAITRFTSSACEKLRRQNSVCSGVSVFIRTSAFSDKPYSSYEATDLLVPTADTRKVVAAALVALEKAFTLGYQYKKAGIQLHGITSRQTFQLNLFDPGDSPQTEILMKCVDAINRKNGPGTVVIGSEGLGEKKWQINRNMHSPRYVTGWKELCKVY